MYYWTEKELDILRKEYPSGNIQNIINKTGKTSTAIIAKAKRLKLFSVFKVNIWYKKVPLHIRIYLAGHFDGEGCARFKKRELQSLSRVPNLIVSVCNLETVQLYQKHFNGTVRKLKKIEGKKQIYRWICNKYEDIYNFILSVIPYSIEKKEQLILLKEFIDFRKKERKTLGLSSDFIKRSNELHNKCTILKKQN